MRLLDLERWASLLGSTSKGQWRELENTCAGGFVLVLSPLRLLVLR